MQTLQSIQNRRNLALTHKHITPLLESLNRLNNIPANELQNATFSPNDFITLHLPYLSKASLELITHIAKTLIPWRKGPFCINSLEILSEWNSAIKYNLLSPHLELKNKIIGDIGCNNGYYMFRMLEQNPKQIIGLDPMPLCKLQFDFMQFFIRDSRLDFKLLGIEDLPFLEIKFDILFCLGVLYHRKSPLDSIKIIYDSLAKNGEAIFDSIIIPGNEEIALCPKNKRYAKMPNVYFIPTLKTFINWLESCGFREITHIATLKTGIDEQKKTSWSNAQSLEDFLNADQSKTIEGYPAPQRAYLKAKKY